jgi:hypothetical protein
LVADVGGLDEGRYITDERGDDGGVGSDDGEDRGANASA